MPHLVGWLIITCEKACKGTAFFLTDQIFVTANIHPPCLTETVPIFSFQAHEEKE